MNRKTIITLLILTIAGCNRKDKAVEAVLKLPSINILLSDSERVINTNNLAPGRSTILMYFSTDCEHCHDQTKAILNKISDFKDARLFFITPMSIDDLRKFNQFFAIKNYKNITTGKDQDYIFSNLYKTADFPSIAIYNKENKLVKIFKGEIDITQIIIYI